MGIFDELLTGLSGEEGTIRPQFAQALEGLLVDMDVPELLGRLEQAGLGGQVQSWLGTGTNLPITPDQLRDALGDEEVEEAAAREGMTPETLLTELAEHLPGLIDRLSPRGELLPSGASPTSLV